MPRPIITLTTDFGEGSTYVAEMKGVIKQINPEADIVDITHRVPPQDVPSGAIALADTTSWYPQGTIHIAVIDPGVGTSRPLLYARFAEQQYVLPDNGLLTVIGQRVQPSELRRIENRRYWLPEITSTFHGRDIMSPVGAHLSLKLNPTLLGPAAEDFTRLDWPTPTVSQRLVVGHVIAVDSFGNAVTNIQRADLPDELATAEVRAGQQQVLVGTPVVTYGEQPSGTRVVLFGSTRRLEVAVVQGSAARELALQIGDEVRVQWRSQDDADA